MEAWVGPAAVVSTLSSALSAYGASPHCRWPWLRGMRFGRGAVAAVLALIALAAWTMQLGFGAGSCAMLGMWMLAAMSLPYLAAWTSTAEDRD